MHNFFTQSFLSFNIIGTVYAHEGKDPLSEQAHLTGHIILLIMLVIASAGVVYYIFEERKSMRKKNSISKKENDIKE